MRSPELRELTLTEIDTLSHTDNRICIVGGFPTEFVNPLAGVKMSEK